MSRKHPKLDIDRILQISNNVAEEFADHGQTNFATKAELCQVIQWWQKECSSWIEDYQKAKYALLRKHIKNDPPAR